MGNYSSRPSSRRPGKSSYRGGQRKSYHSGGNRNNKRRFGQNIDPKRFVKAAKEVEIEEYLPTHKFTDFDLNTLIQQNLVRKEYITPSQVQDKSIPHALEGRDVIGIANTGTGKTAAFLLPMLTRFATQKRAKGKNGVRALILAPTRELVIQIQNEIVLFQ